MNKEEIRIAIKDLRNKMNPKTVSAYSLIIEKKLIKLLNDTTVNNFFIYKSFAHEVNTNYLIKYLLEHNKNVFLPRIEKDTLLAIPYNKTSKMQFNKFGIVEPLGDPIDLDNFICIIPLLAIDKKGNRIGFGKGYYDNFLNNKECLKIGICYDYQIIDKIVPSSQDIPLDIVITEKRTLRFKQYKKKKRE